MQRLLAYSEPEEFLNPNFGSAFIFELHKDTSNNYFVKVLYKNDPYPQEINLIPFEIDGKKKYYFLMNF